MVKSTYYPYRKPEFPEPTLDGSQLPVTPTTKDPVSISSFCGDLYLHAHPHTDIDTNIYVKFKKKLKIDILDHRTCLTCLVLGLKVELWETFWFLENKDR